MIRVAVGLALLLAAEIPFWTELPKERRRGPAPTLADLADRARPAVVHVRATVIETGRAAGAGAGGRGAPVSVGSGFFIDRDGHLVTNEHVVRGAGDIRVRLYDGRELPACVLGADEPTDVALLKLEIERAVPVLPLGDSDAVRVGEPAFAIGSPFEFAHSLTAGIVSAKDRVVDRGDRPGDAGERGGGPGAAGPSEPYSFYIQTDASINVGNSGGPLLDAHGAVIGINAAFWGGPLASPGVSFAIPINIVKRLLPRLRRDGEAPRSFLGVESQPLTASLVAALRLSAAQGALIAGVVPGSPAELAGIEPGDVVLAWDGQSVTGNEDFKIYAQLTPPHTRVKMRVLRDGQTIERVTSTRPVEERAPRPRHPASCRLLSSSQALPDGFEAADLAPARARDLPGGRGVEVARVQGGAAREAGILPGDVVLRAGRTAIRTVEELRRALREAPGSLPVPLLLRRHGSDFWTALPRR